MANYPGGVVASYPSQATKLNRILRTGQKHETGYECEKGHYPASNAILVAHRILGWEDIGPFNVIGISGKDRSGSPIGGTTVAIPKTILDKFLYELSKNDNIHHTIYIDNEPYDLDLNEQYLFGLKIVNAVKEWSSGCNEGKERFLISLFGSKDLIPKPRVNRMRVVLEMDAIDNQDTINLIASRLEKNWRYTYTNIKIVT